MLSDIYFQTIGKHDKKWQSVWREKAMPHDVSPRQMAGMQDALSAIIPAIIYNTPIAIVGDYDVDGMTSTAILIRFLQTMKHDATVWVIPTRADGYGLSRHVVEKVMRALENISHVQPRYEHVEGIVKPAKPVLITVDNGITAFDAVSYANDYFTVVVTDHHNLSSQTTDSTSVKVDQSYIPDAYAVVNPQRPDCPYPTRHLSGSAVAFRLVHALCEELSDDRYFQHLDFQHDNLLRYTITDASSLKYYWTVFYIYAGFGTVADMMPLDELENRHIVAESMKQIDNFPTPIFTAMLEHSETWLDKSKPLTYKDIGFSYAPPFNAVGRIGDPSIGVQALIETDTQKAMDFVAQLLGYNNERKRIQNSATSSVGDAIDTVIVEIDLNKPCLVIEAEVPSGLSGLVAGDLCRRYSRPVLVGRLKTKPDGTTVFAGSARSTSTVPITDVFAKLSSYMTRFGGHDGAAGFELLADNMSAFESAINETIASDYPNWREPEPDYSGAIAISLSQVNQDLIIELQNMQPIGDSTTPVPLFAVVDAEVADAKSWGKNNHLKAMVIDTFGNKVSANAWNMGNVADSVNQMDRADVVCNIEVTTFPYLHTQLSVVKVLPHGQVDFEHMFRNSYGDVPRANGFDNDSANEPDSDIGTSVSDIGRGEIPRVFNDGGSVVIMTQAERAKRYGDTLSGRGKRRI